MTDRWSLAVFQLSGNDSLVWSEWSWTPGIVIPLVLVALAYGCGVARMTHRPLSGGLRWKQPLFFTAGWFSLFLALLSPIHELGEQLFWVHMTQHEVLVLVCAPLLVSGHPLRISLWALPLWGRKTVARAVHGAAFAAARTAISRPVCAWALHAVALLVWHIPALFDATLTSPAMHAAQHLSFLSTGLLFWWTLLNPSSALGYGAASLYVFSTAVYTSLLGALLTFSQRPWYPPYAASASVWHFSGLEDQQLGGLIMWIPGGTILFVMTLFMVAKWLRESEIRGERTSTAALLRKSPTVPYEN
jgi:putative membrane protein